MCDVIHLENMTRDFPELCNSTIIYGNKIKRKF